MLESRYWLAKDHLRVCQLYFNLLDWYLPAITWQQCGSAWYYIWMGLAGDGHQVGFAKYFVSCLSAFFGALEAWMQSQLLSSILGTWP